MKERSRIDHLPQKLLALTMALILAAGVAAFAQQPEPVAERVEIAVGGIGFTNEFIYGGIHGTERLGDVGGITGRISFYDLITFRGLIGTETRDWQTHWGEFRETDNTLSELLIFGELDLAGADVVELPLRLGLGFGSKDVVTENIRGKVVFARQYPFYAPTLEIGLEIGSTAMFVGAQQPFYFNDYPYRDFYGRIYAGMTVEFSC